MAAGAILSQLEEQRLSPEALTAVVVFDANERQASTVAC